MLKEFLTPAHSLSVAKDFTGEKDQLGTILQNSSWNESALPDAVILGIDDERIADLCFSRASDTIRGQLYQLRGLAENFKMVDLGNVRRGTEVTDTLAALCMVAEEVANLGIPLLFLGGDQQLTLPLLTGMSKNGAVLTVVDDRIDNHSETEPSNEGNYLNNLQVETTVNVMGVQSYFVSPESKDSFSEEFNGNLTTLGELRQDISEMEPILRETDLVSFDFGSLKICEAPGQIKNSPNGLTGEEACQLAWYSGISTHPGWFSLFGYDPGSDPEKHGAMMAAQIAWYFLNGKSRKIDDVPQDEAIDFIHYIVPIEGIPDPVTFLKHPVSKRWWMEVPSPDCDLFPLRVPCSKKDYRKACKNEIPDRWWSSFNKSY